MMDDLISRQAAIDAVYDLPNCPNGYSDTYDKAYIIGLLEELPAAEPKKGKWMKTVTLYPYCSECDWMPEEDEMTHGFYRYCPNCGARMEE